MKTESRCRAGPVCRRQRPVRRRSPDTPPGEGTAETPIVPGRISVRRPDDLLLFDATFGGFLLKKNPTRLERSAAEAFIVFEFPPQSFGEEAFLETDQQKIRRTCAPGRRGGRGIERFAVPEEERSGRDAGSFGKIASPLARAHVGAESRRSLDARRADDDRLRPGESVDRAPRLADASRRQCSIGPARRSRRARRRSASRGPGQLVDLARRHADARRAEHADESARAAPAPQRRSRTSSRSWESPHCFSELGPHEPTSTVTALELPYRVVTSPLAPARWRHAIAPVAHRAHTELWHTRLGAQHVGVRRR